MLVSTDKDLEEVVENLPDIEAIVEMNGIGSGLYHQHYVIGASANICA